jgi:four helix bundle protein
MRATCLEDLLVYRKAIASADAVSALLTRKPLRDDFRLRTQLAASSERVASLIAEGFGLKTDRHFAAYLYNSRGSSKEVRTQLRVAVGRRYVTPAEGAQIANQYNEIERMLTGLIRYLNAENRKQRG